jgi:hypothetical protein
MNARAPQPTIDPARHAGEFLGMKAVYSFVFPETRAVVSAFDAAFRPELMRVLTPAAALAQFVREQVSPTLAVPATKGYADLDSLAYPLTERVAQIYAGLAEGIDQFPFRYPVAGSAEGLFHLYVDLRRRGFERIRVLPGEYEGYGIQAANVGLSVETIPLEVAASTEPDPHAAWFISSPSARDGNQLPRGWLAELLAAGHQVVLDLAYLGATAPGVIFVDHPGVLALTLSLSKPYGLFRWRIGYVFSRAAIPSLYGSRWFGDLGRHLLGLKILEEIGPHLLYPRYVAVQREIVAGLNRDGMPLRASDVLLLGHLSPAEWIVAPAPVTATLAPFVRGDRVRVCLTPYFEARFP